MDASRRSGPSTQTVVVKVTDNGNPNLSGTNLFVIVVAETNARPRFSPSPMSPLDELTLLSFSITATDPDIPANSLSYGLVSGPGGLTVSAAGLVTWTPTEAQGPPPTLVLVRATDNGVPSRSVTNQFTVVVREVNTAPTTVSLGVLALDELTSLSASVTASDTDVPGNTLTYQLISGPTGLTVSSSGAVAWNPGETDGPSTNAVLVGLPTTDPQLSATNQFSVIVREVNSAPSITSPPPPRSPNWRHSPPTDWRRSGSTAQFPVLHPALRARRTQCKLGGLATWSPSAVFNRTTNQFIVRVTDSGIPSLSGTNQFTVIVALPRRGRFGRLELPTIPGAPLQSGRRIRGP